MIEDESELADLLSLILDDYRDNSEFFSTHELPEYGAMESLTLDDRDLALFLTFTCVTNHIHNETEKSKKTDGDDGLWQVSARLWRENTWMFRPEELVGNEQRNRLEMILADEEIMDSRDPKWWYTNAVNLYDEYDSDPRKLLATDNHVAPDIETRVQRERFLGLRGDKIRPLWIRLMDEEIHSLDQIGDVPIPADYHIVTMTNRLGETDFDPRDQDDLKIVRSYWRTICEKHGFIAVELDKPLWLLNKYWNPNGRKYLETRLEELRS